MNDRDIRLVFAERFLRNAKRLQKKYRHIQDAIRELTEQLKRGETPGERIQGIAYVVFKVRIRNTDAGKGKRGGYRVIYYVKTEDRIVLLTIYAKSEQTDISSENIQRIIEETPGDLPD